MAALLTQTLNVTNGGTRILLLILLLLAIILILAGAIIAIFTFTYARKQRSLLNDRVPFGERR